MNTWKGKAISSRLLKNAHLPVKPGFRKAQAAVPSLLGISSRRICGMGIFDQPAQQVFFSNQIDSHLRGRQPLLMAHKGYVMENGRMVLEGEGKALLENEHIKKTYLGI